MKDCRKNQRLNTSGLIYLLHINPFKVSHSDPIQTIHFHLFSYPNHTFLFSLQHHADPPPNHPLAFPFMKPTASLKNEVGCLSKEHGARVYLSDEVVIGDLNADVGTVLVWCGEAVLDQHSVLRCAEQRHHHRLNLVTQQTQRPVPTGMHRHGTVEPPSSRLTGC